MLKALTGMEVDGDCSVYDTVIVKNSAFNRSMQPWSLNYFPEYGANAKAEVINGEARLELLSPGQANWHTQFIYLPFPLKEGYTYTFQFDSYASAPVTIQADIGRDGGDYSIFQSINADLTTEKKTFTTTFTFDRATENTARIVFECGLAQVQYIYFDNVHLYETAPGATAVINPEITQSQCTVNVKNSRYTVDGNTIESVVIYDIQGRKLYQKRYEHTNYAEIASSSLPPNIGFIEVNTDVKREVLKYLNQ
jgi:hypothetical protein